MSVILCGNGDGRLRIFKRKISRKIYDPVVEKTTWYIRYNQDCFNCIRNQKSYMWNIKLAGEHILMARKFYALQEIPVLSKV
jgi:hypothetical protein